jgi:NAD(P)-dependent dehydrogenase (short-subunit alcohol dehydrogenase family)
MMAGKVVLITGASSGIGLEAARKLALDGAEIIMICRDRARGRAAQREIAKAATGAPPTLLLADISRLSDVRAVGAEIRTRFARIDVLINNAGSIFADRELTAEGIEKTFATNHLGPFLLTVLLLDRMRAAPAGRIVNVGSSLYPGKLDFDNLQGERTYNFLGAYFRSKLDTILFTYELARRLAGTSVTANCFSPGPVRTNFGLHIKGWQSLFPRFMKMLVGINVEEGARTSIYLASAPEVAGISGRFYFREREIHTKPVTHDPLVASRLWQISEELCSPQG